MSSAQALLQNLPIENLQASTTNPRRHIDRAGLDELKVSIAESGIHTPLLVRECDPIDALDGVFEIVAGERLVRVAFMKLLLAKAMENREAVLRKMVEDALEDVWDIEDEDLASALGIPFVAAKDANQQARNRAASAAIEKYISTAMVDELIRVGAALEYAGRVMSIDGPGSKDADRKSLDAIAKKLGFKWTAPDAVKPAAKKAAKPAAKKAVAKKAAKPVSRTLTAEGRKRIADAMKKRFEERKSAAKPAGER